MIYKILMGICLLSLSACDTKYLGDSVHAKSVEQPKLEKSQSNLSNVKSSQNSKDIKRALDNKIYVLLNSKEGCIVSEKPLNNDIVVIYKEAENFKYDVVKPISKKDDTDCVSNLTFVTDEPNYFYNIDKKTKTSIRGYGFELSKNQIMYNNGKIRGVDLIGNGIPNIITECFSSEGSHFNIWGGANNEEKLLHRYTFLDMNMQASCTENDKIFSPGLLDLKK
ncbi:hypothetical protein KTH06_12910 [Acinetobacter ursingii]|uniref:hypothetical protein n=1 Tax=Acinetobacter ursingii TaxID=108980 RepID=UPI00148F2166|nr:hypothetical protein [Acinetobacter ursingii]MCU4306713.1 hypothetical protein [Acinetobacter ursingii]MCU4372817.1 hypothetical protein [Acinetobacter ursingii]MCU4382372.1 hypothetical protein [Acinetobacter ursingii]MDG9993189.1 hypothetical protein [Acinetobacter ursingii]MDH0205411.1 hypothetical protein [Acinetobacter ursingii]